MKSLSPLWLGTAMVVSSAAVYLQHAPLFRMMLHRVDGVIFAAIAKYGYNSPVLCQQFTSPAHYFLSHNLLFPVTIRLGVLATGDYLTAMILSSLTASVAAVILFYFLLKKYELVKDPFWTAVLFCVFTPGWILLHASGASEPLFFCFIFGAFLFFAHANPLGVAACILLACLTRFMGIVLIPVFLTLYLLRREWRNMFIAGMGGLLSAAIILIFSWATYGDALIFLSRHLDDYQTLQLIPFRAVLRKWFFSPVFTSPAYIFMILTFEFYVMTFAVYLLGTFALYPKRELFIFCLSVLVLNAFIDAPDFHRFLLPAAPFALLVSFDSVLTSRPCRYAWPVILFLYYQFIWQILPLNLHPESLTLNLMK